MKRVILSLVAVLAAVSMGAQVRPQNNHTVSTTLGAGLEYGFEWAYAGQATVVVRAGYVSTDWTLRSALDNFQWASTMVPGLTLEPRYYLLMNQLDRNGKDVAGNSAPFVGVPATVTLAKGGKALGLVAVSPVLGFRRAFARHAFHEFTVGADLACYPQWRVTPHAGYRIGLLF